MGKSTDKPVGRWIGIAVAIVGIAGIGWFIWTRVAPDEALAAANNPTFINAETGYVFHSALTPGMPYPVKCPDTGKQTGYQAELCYWTKDGHPKTVPTAVLLNSDKGLPEPTFCPDCGRLVIHHNPLAIEGHKAPPTQEEYSAGR